MSTSTITVGGQSVTLVGMPECPAPREVQFGIYDSVALVQNPFNGVSQTQPWPGGERITATVTLPPLTAQQWRWWKAWLMSMRGMQNAMQMGDIDAQFPQGQALGVPVVDGAVTANNAAGATTLYTKGWTASVNGQLLPGDAMQIGYRYYAVADAAVNSDANGKAQISIWPGLREQPADGTAIVLAKPRALFRLAKNDRSWSRDVTRLTRMSFALTEWR